MRHLLLVSVALLVLSVSGCYDTKHEVFGPNDGVIVPGLDGQYDCVKKVNVNKANKDVGCGRYTVFWAGRGTDYRVIAQLAPGASQSFGALRAVPIGAGVYVVQLHYDAGGPNIDEPDLYAQTYFRVTRSSHGIERLEELLPEEGAAWAIAQRDGIDVWGQFKKADGLSGPHTALERFLRDLRSVSFMTAATYSRIRGSRQ